MTNGAAILLVEDDALDAELILRVFRENYSSTPVAVARDGEEALDLLFPQEVESEPSRPSVVLLDLKLPKVHGFEVLQRIRSDPQTRSLPVVILTSSRETSDLQQAYALGANSYLCKPVEFEDFVRVIKSVGQYWLLLNELPES